jgi:sugar (pentulose or hexulose) kinase
MLAAFDRLVAENHYPWTLADLLPEILPVGTPAGTLTPAGAALLDPSGTLQPGAVFCPPEGDAGTGMVATNSVAPGTGTVSAGTSVFAMVVLDQPLARVHREIDMVTTPCGHPVAMVHANNCSSQVNVIAGLLRDFAAAMGQPVPDGKIYDFLFNSAVDGAPDCDGIVTYGYTSGESILNLDAGRPLTVRRADSTVNWPNLMRSNLCGALAALKVGMDILTRDEQVPLQRIYGHGGFFTTPQVGQRLLASALAAPVTVMETAGSGGPWGMALLAAYMLQRQNGERLAAFLERQVFACCQTVTVEPTAQDVANFDAYMQAFHAALDLERRAAEGE